MNGHCLLINIQMNVNYKSFLPLLNSEIIKFLKNVHGEL